MAASTAPAQSAWLSRFNGPVLRRKVSFGSPLVQHLFRRSFEHVGRNVHMVSVYGRVLLGEDKINEAEVAIYKRIDEITKAIERKVASSGVVVKDAELDMNMASYNRPIEMDANIVVPAQTKFLRLLELSDAYAQNFFTLWLAAEIDDKEKSKLEFELKKLMRQIPVVTRKMREFIHEKLAESDHQDAKREAAELVADIKDDDEIDGDGEDVQLNESGAPVKEAKPRGKGKSAKANDVAAAEVVQAEPLAA